MMMITRLRTVCRFGSVWPLLLACGAWLVAPQPVRGNPPDAPLRVFVSIPPQKYFVEQVGGSRVHVSVLLEPGQSPATYEITPRQLVALGAARVYFRIGVPFEKSVVAKIGGTLEKLRIVDMRRGITLRALTADEQHEHEHDHGHEAGHEHAADADTHGEPGDLDPHVWMNPRLVKLQARTICDEFIRLDPDYQAAFEQRRAAFEAELDRIDAVVAAKLAPFRGREFFVYHPAYGYFADAYGLRQTAVQSGGKSPTAKQLATLIRRAKEAGVRLIFVQPQFDRSSAETIAEAIGGVVVPMDPLAEDYLANLLEMADRIETALSGAAPHKP
jgi:zinc transport system substrate-binding protein